MGIYGIITPNKGREFYKTPIGGSDMPKISRKASVLISICLTVLFLAVLIVCAFAMPMLCNVFADIATMHPGRSELCVAERIYLLVAGYLIVAVAAVADILMFLLLLRIRRGLVFTRESVSVIRAVSWCAICCGVIFALLGYIFYIAYVIAVAVLFLGLCLRVVKNVIEEATELKNENDLTV